MPLSDELTRHGLSDAVARVVETQGDLLRMRTVEAGVEFAIALDAETGASVGLPLKGTAAGVDMDDHVRAMRVDGRYVAIHTHPASSAFSDVDVATFLRVRMLATMVVVGLDRTWYVLSKSPGAALQDHVEAAGRLRAEVLRLMPWYRAQVQAGRIDPREAWRVHSNEAWLTVAPEVGLRYSRVETSEAR